MNVVLSPPVILLAGVVPAAIIALAGSILLVRRSFVLKKRFGAYERLPVAIRIAEANASIASHVQAIASAGDTVTRLQRAIAEISDARARLATSAAMVKSMRSSRSL